MATRTRHGAIRAEHIGAGGGWGSEASQYPERNQQRLRKYGSERQEPKPDGSPSGLLAAAPARAAGGRPGKAGAQVQPQRKPARGASDKRT